MHWFFVSDLHGNIVKYKKLFDFIERKKPNAVLFGGDLLPSGLQSIASNLPVQEEFITDFLFGECSRIKSTLKNDYPEIFMILGNDDSKADEDSMIKGEEMGFWKYISEKIFDFEGFQLFGYPYVPPTPFMIKDFEKYDISQYIDPGCVPLEDGMFSYDVNKSLLKRDTIKKDLDQLAEKINPSKAIILFHTPPYQTLLDRADLDGKFYEHVPLDVHIGSIAVKRFIEKHQPLITLHGHVHESSRLTESWSDKIGETYLYSAAYDQDELAIIIFDPNHPDKAERILL